VNQPETHGSARPTRYARERVADDVDPPQENPDRRDPRPGRSLFTNSDHGVVLTRTSVEFPHREVASFVRADLYAALRPCGYEYMAPGKEAPLKHPHVGIVVDVEDDYVQVDFPDEAAALEAQRLAGSVPAENPGATIAEIILAVHMQMLATADRRVTALRALASRP
jgi:hypothetical protein